MRSPFSNKRRLQNHLVGPAISYGRERCFGGGGGVRLIRLVRNFVKMVWEALVDLPTWDVSKGRFFRRGMISNPKPITDQQTNCLNHLSYKKNSKTIQHTGCFKDLYEAIRMNSIMTSAKNSQPFSESTLLFWSFLYTPENEQPPALQRKKPSELILVFQPFIFRGVSNTTAPKKASGLPVCPRSSTGSSSFSKS